MKFVKRAFTGINQGLKDLVEMLDFVLFSLDTFKEAQADGGGVNWKDSLKLLNLITPANLALEGDENIWPSLQTASEDDLLEVLDYLNSGAHVTQPYTLETVQLAEKLVVDGFLLWRHLQAGKPAEDAPATDDLAALPNGDAPQ